MSSVCRICLAGNTRLHSLKNNLLIITYEKMSTTKFNSENARPRAICCYCYQTLLRCHTFSQMAHRSEKIFSNLFRKGIEVTHEYITEFDLGMKQHLSVSMIQVVSIDDNTTNADSQVAKDEPIPSSDIKEEVPTEQDDQVKIEFVHEDSTKDQLTLEDSDQENDTEELPPNIDVEQIKPDDSKTTFICNDSNKIFSHKNKFVSHISNSHSQLTVKEHCNTKQCVVKTSIVTDIINNNRKKPFACNICKKRFRQKVSFRHLQIHTGEKPFTCNVCDKKFNRKFNLAAHMRIHTGEEHSNTKQCAKITSMVKDKVNHNRKKSFACDLCKKRFCLKGTLVKHLQIHSGEEHSNTKQRTKITSMVKDKINYNRKKSFACELCKKRFCHKGTLVRHLQVHTGEKPFTCNVCDKQFNRKYNLSAHMTSHTGVKPFTCNVCDKQFHRNDQLVIHMRIHTGEKPFVCNVCDKRFNQNSSLLVHMKIHTGDKPFFCYVCDKQFNRSHHLVTHMRIHTGEKPFVCNVCGKQFNQNNVLVRHMRIHTGMPFSCYVCDKQFTHKSAQVKHMRIHMREDFKLVAYMSHELTQ